jgi:hypothetical protein
MMMAAPKWMIGTFHDVHVREGVALTDEKLNEIAQSKHTPGIVGKKVITVVRARKCVHSYRDRRVDVLIFDDGQMATYTIPRGEEW